jgi:hypothetical protein
MGSTVPVVLRRLESENGLYYHFIGQAYIHGVIRGEAGLALENLQAILLV